MSKSDAVPAGLTTRMGVYDQAARFAAKPDPDAVLSRLFVEAGLSVTFASWFETRSYPLPAGPDRNADQVAVADEVVSPPDPIPIPTSSSSPRCGGEAAYSH